MIRAWRCAITLRGCCTPPTAPRARLRDGRAPQRVQFSHADAQNRTRYQPAQWVQISHADAQNRTHCIALPSRQRHRPVKRLATAEGGAVWTRHKASTEAVDDYLNIARPVTRSRVSSRTYVLRRFVAQVGVEIMVVFTKQGDQPDHARLAARGARLPEGRPGGQPGRARSGRASASGVNSGGIVAGVLGDHGHRSPDVTGDTFNLATRLEGAGPAGEAVSTRQRQPAARGHARRAVPPARPEGKSEPLRAYILRALPD
jgi:class 3 adenylate cyclase